MLLFLGLIYVLVIRTCLTRNSSELNSVSDAALPQPPESITVLEVTFNSVMLAWNSTGNTTTAPVKSYLVLYWVNDSSADCDKVSTLRPNVLLSGLSASTAYEFHVHAVSDVGQSLLAASVVVTTSNADTSIHQFIIIISVVGFIMLALISSFILVCVKCPHFCVVDVMTYRQERNRLRRRMEQNRGKSMDLMHYLQLRKLQLERQQRNMNTAALYYAVSEEINAAR